jgi:D-alanyl-D-alanine carboxypeptidase
MKKVIIVLVCLLMAASLAATLISGLFKGQSASSSQAEDSSAETVSYTTREQVYANANPDLEEAEVKERVWLGLDQAYYENAKVLTNPSALDALVSKHRSLGEYVPDDLEELPQQVEGEVFSLRKEASEAAQDLMAAAKEKGLEVVVVGGWQSAEDTDSKYDQAADEYSAANADMYLSKAGYSDYQTGLAADFWIIGQEALEDISKQEGYDDFVELAVQYGFIQPYTEANESLSQMSPQAWHFRYVGKDLAKTLSESGQAFETYIYETYA